MLDGMYTQQDLLSNTITTCMYRPVKDQAACCPGFGGGVTKASHFSYGITVMGVSKALIIT